MFLWVILGFFQVVDAKRMGFERYTKRQIERKSQQEIDRYLHDQNLYSTLTDKDLNYLIYHQSSTLFFPHMETLSLSMSEKFDSKYSNLVLPELKQVEPFSFVQIYGVILRPLCASVY